ncbi:MAG: hypothetical protein ACI8W8_002724 [Rhodothermales bacterium]|jgi:hypothetical protein
MVNAAVANIDMARLADIRSVMQQEQIALALPVDPAN